MNGPDLELKLDNLIAELALEIAQIQKDRKFRASIDARLERLERVHAIPLVYTLKQAAARLGDYKPGWAYKHPELLPIPCSVRPLRYRVSDVEALARGIPKTGRKGSRAGRVKEAS
jgi:hypothetical protein